MSISITTEQETPKLLEKYSKVQERVKEDLIEEKQGLLFSVLYTISDDLK